MINPIEPGFAKTPGRNAVIPNEADAGGGMREPSIYLNRFMDKGIPDPPDVGSGMTLVLIMYC